MVWLAVVMTGSLCSLAILHRWTHSRTMRYWEIKYRERKQNQCNVRRESWLWLKAAQAIPQLTVSSSLCKLCRWGVGRSKQFYGMLKQWRDWYREGKELKKKPVYSLAVLHRRGGSPQWKKIDGRECEQLREGECASIGERARGRERERELRCSSIPQQTAEDCRCVCVWLHCWREEEEADLQTLQGRRGTHSGRASAGPHQVEVPGPSPRRPSP